MKSEAQVDANRAGAPKCVPLNGFAKVEGVRAIREIQDADAHRHLGPTAVVECLRRREIRRPCAVDTAPSRLGRLQHLQLMAQPKDLEV
jgi:hypothetical protein